MPVDIREGRWLPVCSWQNLIKSHDSHTRSEKLGLETFSIRKIWLLLLVILANYSKPTETVESAAFGYYLALFCMAYYLGQ